MTNKHTETHACDCGKKETHGDVISRQAAIRWIKTECNPYGKPTLDFESGKKVIEHLERMPSAEPEIIRCKDCIWRDGSVCMNNNTMPWSDDDFCSNAERRTDEADY